MSKHNGRKWKIRHVLRDGTVLRPGEGLPTTSESIKIFESVRKRAHVIRLIGEMRKVFDELALAAL